MDFYKRSFVSKLIMSALAVSGIPIISKAVSLNTRYGTKKPKYYSFLLTNFFNWYCKDLYDFNKKFSKADLDYLQYCLANMDQLETTRHEVVYPPNFLFSPDIDYGVSRYSRIYMGSTKRDIEFQKLAQKSLASHGVKLPIEKLKNLFGIGYDFEENLVKVFWEHQSVPNIDLAEAKFLDYSLSQNIYKNGKLINEREIGFLLPMFPLNTLHRSQTTTQTVTVAKDKSGKIKYYWDTRYGSTHILPPTQNTAEKFIKSFALSAYKFSERNDHHFQIYYP